MSQNGINHVVVYEEKTLGLVEGKCIIGYKADVRISYI